MRVLEDTCALREGWNVRRQNQHRIESERRRAGRRDRLSAFGRYRRDALKLGAGLVAAARFARSQQEIVGSSLPRPNSAERQIETAACIENLPPVFPKPKQLERSGTPLLIDEETAVLLPTDPSADDRALSRFLVKYLSDDFGFNLRTQYCDRLPETGRFILLGAIQNRLVHQYSTQQHLNLTQVAPGPEGYVLRVDEHVAIVGGSDARGAFYGLQSLRQLIGSQDHRLTIPAARIRDWPDKPFRGIKLYLLAATASPSSSGLSRTSWRSTSSTHLSWS